MGFMKEAQQQRSIAVAHFYQHCSAASGIALLFAILYNTVHLALCNTLQYSAPCPLQYSEILCTLLFAILCSIGRQLEWAAGQARGLPAGLADRAPSHLSRPR